MPVWVIRESEANQSKKEWSHSYDPCSKTLSDKREISAFETLTVLIMKTWPNALSKDKKDNKIV